MADYIRIKRRKIIKEIKKEELQTLIKKNIVHCTRQGYRNSKGGEVGIHRTNNRWFAEDKYVEMARKL